MRNIHINNKGEIRYKEQTGIKDSLLIEFNGRATK